MHVGPRHIVTSGVAEAVLAWLVLAVALLALVRPLWSLGERVTCDGVDGLRAVTVASPAAAADCSSP